MRNSLLIVSGTLLVMSIAACGAGGDDTLTNEENRYSVGDSEVAEDPQLAFFGCLRDNGVDIADPEPGETIQLDGLDFDDPEVRAVLQECQELLFPDGSPPEPDEEGMDALREFTACMRDNGVDMDDPGPDGGLTIPEGIDPNESEFQEAIEECQEFLAGQQVGIRR